MEITLEEIQKKFESLPENLKWAIMSANVDDNIIEIGKQHNLNVEQMGQLSLETNMEMFGFTSPENFESSVKNSLGLPDEKIRAIVDDINDKILKTIVEKMMGSSSTSRAENTKVEDEKSILSSAGIEIVPEKLEIAGEVKVTTPPSPAPSILAQKLSAPVQTTTTKTEHSLENITKTDHPTPEVIKPNTPTTYPKNGDPYRLPPE